MISLHLLKFASGSLPTDIHTSLYSLPGDVKPAALAKYSSSAPQIGLDDFPVPPPPPPLPGFEELDAEAPSETFLEAATPAVGFHTMKSSPVS